GSPCLDGLNSRPPTVAMQEANRWAPTAPPTATSSRRESVVTNLTEAGVVQLPGTMPKQFPPDSSQQAHFEDYASESEDEDNPRVLQRSASFDGGRREPPTYIDNTLVGVVAGVVSNAYDAFRWAKGGNG
ncbi:hypothetical protein HK104_002827, partial [Borealophlyctis nickersoniae]